MCVVCAANELRCGFDRNLIYIRNLCIGLRRKNVDRRFVQIIARVQNAEKEHWRGERGKITRARAMQYTHMKFEIKTKQNKKKQNKQLQHHSTTACKLEKKIRASKKGDTLCEWLNECNVLAIREQKQKNTTD